MRKKTPITIRLLTLASLFVFSSSLFAADKQDIDKILNQKEAPDGIVFEVIGSDEDYLSDAIERIQQYQKRLQIKFPKLDIAVVSHGSEQFALTKNYAAKNALKNKETHKNIKRLIDSDVPVYICETHASWRDVQASDFPSYITIAAQGPAQIKQYQELGYRLIVIEEK